MEDYTWEVFNGPELEATLDTFPTHIDQNADIWSYLIVAERWKKTFFDEQVTSLCHRLPLVSISEQIVSLEKTYFYLKKCVK